MSSKFISEAEYRRHVARINQRMSVGDQFRGGLVLSVIGGLGSAMIFLYVLGWVLRHGFHIHPPTSFFPH